MTTKQTELKESLEVQDKINTENTDVLLSIQDLRIWFELRHLGFGHAGYVHAVDGVSFNLHNREAIAIVGESGCGKSSLMKTILALYQPTRGKILFAGRDLIELKGNSNKWYRSKVGFVQQDPYGAMAPFMNIQRILEEPLVINGIKDKEERIERIHKVLNEVKMEPADEFLPKFPHMLSGGQQQRVVIARAMILQPKLLIADEPVSMLDASVRVEILKLLRGLQDIHDLAVIYVTHDLSTVRYFSDKVFVMYAGKIIEKSEVNLLVNDPLHPYTQALLEATSEPDSANAKIMKQIPPGEPPSLVNPPAGCRFHLRCPHIIKGVCDVKEPPEFIKEENHIVSCWLYE